ncbi:hypothetical protein MD484_g6607, partial [Candolleomyces efflorescens]
MRQFVKLTAFGSQTFQEAHDRIESIRQELQTNGKNVVPLKFLPYEGSTCIEAHARYFTDRNLVPFEKSQPFSAFVDPFSVLADLRPDVFIHGADNKVDYLKRTADRKGCTRYTYEDPANFRTGDIVEIAFSCVAVPIKEDKHMMFLNLKALTLLDNSVRKDAEKRIRVFTPPATPQKLKTFKRRQVAYLELDYGVEEGGSNKKAREDETSEDKGEKAKEGGEGVDKGVGTLEKNFSGMNVD